MQITIKAPGVPVTEMTTAVNAEWQHFLKDDKARNELLEKDVRVDDISVFDAFEVKQAAEGYGVVELMLIAAGGRLVATIPERIIVRVFDDYVWPKLQARFGSGVERVEDGK